MRRRVALVSSCAPPLPGHPVTGGGLRTAQLLQTLKLGGHAVTLLVERDALPKGAPKALRDHAFTAASLAADLAALKPAVVVLEQWGMAAALGDLELPLAIDLHGSLLLENVYRRGAGDLTLDAGAKIEALRRADLLLCPAAVQLHHFASWLTVAGFDPRELPLALLPLSTPTPPPPPCRAKKPALKLVYGGARWPWIDSLAALSTAADVVSGIRGARLDVFVYEPPRHGLRFDDELGSWGEVDAALKGRSKAGIRCHPRSEHAAYRAFLRETATVALDLWELNPERMLAATTRSIEYLGAGLPVITVEGAAWAESLLASGAGWTVPPGDQRALEDLLRQLSAEPERIAAASRAATELINERHLIEDAGAALLAFCAKPMRPPRTKASLVSAMVAIRETHLVNELGSLREAHDQEHTRLVRMHAIEVAEQRAGAGEKVASLSAEHGAEIAALSAEHREQVAALSQAQDTRIDELSAAHRREIGALSATHRAEMSEVVKAEQRRLTEAAERERDRLVASQRQELARQRTSSAQEREKLLASSAAAQAALQEERRAETARIVAVHEEQVQGLVERQRAELDARVAELSAMVSSRQQRIDELGEELVQARVLGKERLARQKVELDGQATAREQELWDQIHDLRRSPVRTAARKLSQAVRGEAGSPSEDGSGGRAKQAARLLKLWASHAIDPGD